MRKFYTMLILSAFVSFCGAQPVLYNGDSVNIKIEDKKEGKWIVFGKNQKDPKFKPDQVVEEGFYNANRKEGIWVRYYPNGNKKSEISYKRGRPNGSFKLYYENGNVEEEGEWTNRLYNGAFKRYYEDGTLEQEKTFDANGKAKGKIVYYYPNGKKELEFNSENGKETGVATRYYPNGDVKEVISFENGDALEFRDKKMVNKPVEVKETIKQKNSPTAQGKVNEAHQDIKDGYAKRFNENKDILMDGEFKGGKLWNGKWYKYDENGLLLKIEIYKNGKYIGDGVIGM